MGQYPITAGVFGKAMRAVGKTGTPDGKPAWVFENQTGDLGTLLNSSLIWCGRFWINRYYTSGHQLKLC